MREKTITITIDERGNSTLDLEGFAGQGCEKVFDDFRGGDMVKVERKKPEYYTSQQVRARKEPTLKEVRHAASCVDSRQPR